MPFINNREATKRSEDRKINGKLTNDTNRRSRVWAVYFIYHFFPSRPQAREKTLGTRLLKSIGIYGEYLSLVSFSLGSYLPAMLPTSTMRPLAFFTSGRNVFVTSISPHKLTSAAFLKSASGTHSVGPKLKTPALLTSPHRPEIETSLMLFYSLKEKNSSFCFTKYLLLFPTIHDNEKEM